MSRTVALARVEIVRLLTSRRWLAAVMVWLVVAKLSADDVASHAFSSGLSGWSAFDVHAAAVNNMFYVGFLLLTTFVMVACDSLAHDRETRLAHIVVTRAGFRQRWWASKAIAVLVAAAVFQAGFLAAAFAVGALEGGTVGEAPSPVALAAHGSSGHVEVDPLFTPPGRDASMLLREVGIALYQTLAFSSVGLLMLAVTSRFALSWLPALISLGVLLVDHALNWLIRDPWYLWVSPTTRLMEAIHSGQVVSHPIPLWSSIVWFVALAGLSSAFATRAISRTDI